MKTYKVEFVKLKKQYASVIVNADSREAAIDMMRKMKQEDFEESECAESSEWKAKKEWSLLDFFRVNK